MVFVSPMSSAYKAQHRKPKAPQLCHASNGRGTAGEVFFSRRVVDFFCACPLALTMSAKAADEFRPGYLVMHEAFFTWQRKGRSCFSLRKLGSVLVMAALILSCPAGLASDCTVAVTWTDFPGHAKLHEFYLVNEQVAKRLTMWKYAKESLSKTTFFGSGLLLGICVIAIMEGKIEINALSAGYMLLILSMYFVSNTFWAGSRKKEKTKIEEK